MKNCKRNRKRPSPTYMPVESDFCDPKSQDLDERHAVRMFIGKTDQQAEVMFRENFLFYHEDLTWMRPKAFRFYIIPAMKYLCSPAADGDCDAISCFHGVLELRLSSRDGPLALTPIKDVVASTIRDILSDFGRYDADPVIYGNLEARYREILEHIEKL